VRKPARSTTHKRKVDSAAPQRLTFKAKGFAEEVRRSFIREYRNRWQGSHIIPSAESRDADIFLRRLEGLASTHASSQASKSPSRQSRKEQLNALGKRLANLADDLDRLDSGAAGFWLHKLSERVEVRTADGRVFPATPEGLSPAHFAVALTREITPLMAKASTAAFAAAKTLPADDVKVDLDVALGIARLFFEHQFDYTTSETGFAALCLRAVFDLARSPKDRADYWLTKARDSDNSARATPQKVDEESR